MTALEKLTDDERKEYWACLALKYAQNVGARTIAKLMKHFGSAYIAVHSLTEWGAIGASHRIKHIQDNSWRETARREWENARDLEADIILWSSINYPPLLKEIPDAPPFFYALGNIELLKNPSVAIIGSRTCSEQGQSESAYLGKSLSACGVTITSGMARGIDRAAHFGALQEIGSSIGVLGSGIDIIYPQRNSDIYFDLKKNGLLVSEFPPSMPPDPTNFPIRNRIISGLSYGVIVVEADLKSGSLITARVANEQGRQVYAIPGSMGSQFSKGCQELIRQGAKSVFRVEDVLEDLFPLLKSELIQAQDVLTKNDAIQILTPKEEKNSSSIKKAEKSQTIETKKTIELQEKVTSSKEKFSADSIEFQILESLESGKKHIDDLCLTLNQSPQEINVALVQLELFDYVTRYEGAWYGIKER